MTTEIQRLGKLVVSESVLKLMQSDLPTAIAQLGRRIITQPPRDKTCNQTEAAHRLALRPLFLYVNAERCAIDLIEPSGNQTDANDLR